MLEVSGQIDVPIPTAAQQVLPLFHYLEFKGSKLDGLSEASLVPASNDAALPVNRQTPTLYRVKLSGLHGLSDGVHAETIRLRGSGTIESVALIPFGKGLSEAFDSAPYRNLGEELPALETTVEIDTERVLSIEGHMEVDRNKWFRYYGAPNLAPRFMEYFAADHGFVPGRQMFKFQPALVERFGTKQPKLQEDPDRPGWAEPSFFRSYKSDTFSNMYRDFQRVPFAMCLDNYPSFMSFPHDGRGTPKQQNFDAAADLVARFLNNQVQHSGRTAQFWEAKNEATVAEEWEYHRQKDVDSWGLLAEFHNKVADTVHQQVPGIKIGGPASAWMQVQSGDFQQWRNHQQFMDQTRGHLDFYSHHFYEEVGTHGAFEKRPALYQGYLLGRLEAILDMFAAHMHGTDNARPILLTEYGSLNLGKSDADYWLRLRTYSAILTRLMQRPEQIEFAVPFLFLASPWDPSNGHATFIPMPGSPTAGRDKKDFQRTPNQYFFQLWRDFRGTRLPVTVSQPYLTAVAARDHNVIHLALSNMGGRRILVKPTSFTGQLNIATLQQRRLHYRDGKVTYHDSLRLDTGTPIPIDPEETTIVRLSLATPPKPKGTLTVRHWYSKPTAVKLTVNTPPFQINVDLNKTPETATLVIGIHRDGGLPQQLQGTINHHPFVIKHGPYKDVAHLFESLEINVPASALTATTEIHFEPQEGLTITSVHIRTRHSNPE